MHNPALTIGLAMVLGMLAQVGSKHLRLPGIVLLLLSGILFGPDGLNWIDPTSCLLYTSPSPRDGLLSRMPSSA